jgi:hypothetical protein
MIKVFMKKAQLTSVDDYMFDMLFESSTLDNACAYVTADNYGELYKFSSITDGFLDIRFNAKDFSASDCPVWYGIVHSN